MLHKEPKWWRERGGERYESKRRTKQVHTVAMGQMSSEMRARVVTLSKAGFPITNICERLLEEGIEVLRKSLYFLLKKHKQKNSIADRKRAARRRVLPNKHFSFIDQEMEKNLELASQQLQAIIVAKYPDLNVSQTTIKQALDFKDTVLCHDQWS